MRTVWAVVALVLCGASCMAQQAPPMDEDAFHKKVFENEHVSVYLTELAAGKETTPHRHERDYLAIFLTDAKITSTPAGKPPEHKSFRAGEARFLPGGVTHVSRNDGRAPYRVMVVEFAARQGAAKPATELKSSHYCNPHSQTACVSEKYLFCTEKLCVEDVTFGPGAETLHHRHSTDHMVIPITALDMTDEIQGKPPQKRTQKPGEVVFLDAGTSHRLVNGPAMTRFIVVVWK